MKRVLAPCDGSANALRAVGHASAMAAESRNPVEVTLLHVLGPYTFTSPLAVSASERLTRERPAAVDAVLGPAQRLLQASGVPCQLHWRVGEPAPEIAAEVKEGAYDAVIMGTRGVGPIANLVLGSVANRVQYLIDVPLTFIK